MATSLGCPGRPIGTPLNCSIASVVIVDGIKGVQTIQQVSNNHKRIGKERAIRTRSGTDGIDSNAFADLLVRQCSCEGNDGTLGRSIVKQVSSSNIVVHGRTVDNG